MTRTRSPGIVRRVSLGFTVVAVVSVLLPRAVSAVGSWSWPVVGPVLRAFEPPRTAFGSGHRGIDIACTTGATIRAPAVGTVSFAGSVGGQRYVTVMHLDGTQSTVSWVDSIAVRRNDAVVTGQILATCGTGHPAAVIPHVHFGIRTPDGTYLDPLDVLLAPRLSAFLRLAPR